MTQKELENIEVLARSAIESRKLLETGISFAQDMDTEVIIEFSKIILELVAEIEQMYKNGIRKTGEPIPCDILRYNS